MELWYQVITLVHRICPKTHSWTFLKQQRGIFHRHYDILLFQNVPAATISLEMSPVCVRLGELSCGVSGVECRIVDGLSGIVPNPFSYSSTALRSVKASSL